MKNIQFVKQKMDFIVSLGQSCVFSSLVYWEIGKRYLLAARHTGGRALDFLFSNESEEEYHRRAVWGRSAPSLEAAPIPLTRPISQRVISAWLLSSSGEQLKQCTDEFRVFLNNQNLLKRADIFHNFLSKFSAPAEEERLVVIYKNGMRTYAVVYKTDIVFPPSVPPLVKGGGASPKMTSMTMAAGGDVTAVAKQLMGPGADFYAGSTYETTVYDVLLTCCAQSGLDIPSDLELLGTADVTVLHENSEVIKTCAPHASLARIHE